MTTTTTAIEANATETHRQHYAACLEIAAGREPNIDDHLRAESVGRASQFEHDINRAKKILQLIDAAGTSRSRKAAKNNIAKAEERLNTEAPALFEQKAKIEQQLESLQTQIDDLTAGKSRAEQKLADMVGAREHLRLRAPDFVRRDYNLRISALKNSFIDVKQMAGRLRTIDAVLTLRWGTGDYVSIQNHVRGQLPRDHPLRELVAVHVSNARASGGAVWEAYLAELTKERAELIPKLDRRTRERDAAIDAAESMLDYYTNGDQK